MAKHILVMFSADRTGCTQNQVGGSDWVSSNVRRFAHLRYLPSDITSIPTCPSLSLKELHRKLTFTLSLPSAASQLCGTKATQVTGQKLESFLVIANKVLPGTKTV